MSGQPRGGTEENCVEVMHGEQGKWNDAPRSQKQNFICQQGPSPTMLPTKFPTPAPPTTGPPTPAPTRNSNHNVDDDKFDDDANDDDAVNFPFHNKPSPITAVLVFWVSNI